MRGAEVEAEVRSGVSLLLPVLLFFLGDRKLTAFLAALFTALTVVETMLVVDLLEPLPSSDSTRARFRRREVREPVPIMVREVGFAGPRQSS